MGFRSDEIPLVVEPASASEAHPPPRQGPRNGAALGLWRTSAHEGVRRDHLSHPDALREAIEGAVVACFGFIDAKGQGVDGGDLTETIACDVERLLEGWRRTADPAQRFRPRLQLIHALADGRLADHGRPGARSDPAVPQDSGFGSHQQTTLLLVQMREQHRERQAELIADLVGYALTTRTSRTTGSNTLILCEPLGRPPEHGAARGLRERTRAGQSAALCGGFGRRWWWDSPWLARAGAWCSFSLTAKSQRTLAPTHVAAYVQW